MADELAAQLEKATNLTEQEGSVSGAPVAVGAAISSSAGEAIGAAVITDIACPHVSAGAEACLECQAKMVAQVTTDYRTKRDSLGSTNEQTIEAGFALFDKLIQAYALTECDEVLTEMESACSDELQTRTYSRYIQALAFLRFKQSRFRDAAALFEKMKVLLGPSAELLENMGHAYNSCGNHAAAEQSFTESLKLIEMRSADFQARSNLGGVLLGLGLVKLNNDDAKGALPLLLRALEWYKRAHPGDHSLQAKAGSSVSRCYEVLKQMDQAEAHIKEAVRIFKVTCGQDCPLTATALSKYAGILLRQQSSQAADVLHEALLSSAAVDMYSLNLEQIAMLLIQIVDNAGPARLQERAEGYSQLCGEMLVKWQKRGETMQDANAAIFYKCYGELTAVGGDLLGGRGHLQEAVTILGALEDGTGAAAMVRQQCVSMLQAIDVAAARKGLTPPQQQQQQKGGAKTQAAAAGGGGERGGGNAAGNSSKHAGGSKR